jgi:hypothetical protein
MAGYASPIRSTFDARMTVEDLEAAVAKLTPDELAKFRAWFETFVVDRFDGKIERDADAGRLDRLAEEGLAEFRAGRARGMVGHFASAEFWGTYERLPSSVRALADKQYALLLQGPKHPALHFTQLGRFRSVRVGDDYRALGVEVPDGVLWLWIGSHADYGRLLG